MREHYLSEPEENVLNQFRKLYHDKFGYMEVLDMEGQHPLNIGPNTVFMINEMMTPGSNVYRGEKVNYIFSQMSPLKVRLIKKLILDMYEHGLKYTRDIMAGKERGKDGIIILNDEDMERNREYEKAHISRIENFKKQHSLERKKKISPLRSKRKSVRKLVKKVVKKCKCKSK
jgi:hypothetical protein